jgi:hypothetical protein
MMRARVGLAVAWLVIGACASTPTQPTRATPARPAAQAPAATQARSEAGREPAPLDPHAPARIETATYVLELTSAADVTIAQRAEVSLTLEGRGGFHVNLEYPLRVELGGSSTLVLERTTLEASDAAEIGDERARWKAQAHWSAAGEQWIAARVQFAMCTEDACVPDERVVAAAVQVR